MEIFKLKEAKEFIESLGYNVHYVAVYGSQNYNLHTEDSDLDYKAIVIPTLDELIYNTKPVSTSVEFNGGLIDIKDIRVYIESMVKCNINFIEILNTKFHIGESPLRNYFYPLLEESGELFLKACYGMIMEKVAALRHPYPSTILKIEKFGYDPKQLHHIVRIVQIMERYINGDIGNFYHTDTSGRVALIEIKQGYINNNEVDDIVKVYVGIAKKIREEYKVNPTFSTKLNVIKLGQDIIKENIINSIKNQGNLNF